MDEKVIAEALGIKENRSKSEILMAMKARIIHFDFNHEEKKRLATMLRRFSKDKKLWLMGLAFIESFGNDYRYKKPVQDYKIVCPKCKTSKTRQLEKQVVELFTGSEKPNTPRDKRKRDAIIVHRTWNIPNKEGKLVETTIALPVIIYNYDCLNCSIVFSYPDIKTVTENYNFEEAR